MIGIYKIINKLNSKTLSEQEKEELKKFNERIIDGYDKTLKRSK